MDVTFVPEAHIERAAHQLLAAYGQKFGPVEAPPIPCEEILECHLDLSLDFDDMDERCQMPQVMGAIWMEEREVWIDQSLDPAEHPRNEGRYRFTLAHEIGHWVLHRHQVAQARRVPLFTGRPAPTIICRTASRKKSIEIQADRFASYLLMPEELLRRQWQELTGSSGAYVAEDELAALGDHSGGTVKIAKWMATDFKVSGQAMQIRLTDLGLILPRRPGPSLFE
jgi:hypothetical protein